MAKSKLNGVAPASYSDASDWKYKCEDALRTLQRAGEIVHDKKLMAAVKVMAAEKAEELTAVAHQASQLAKMGRISPKQMAKLASR